MERNSKQKIPFSKILVANRGEIACRVIRTCREMGIKTVAVYSDVDSAALHVQQADEAVLLGPPAPEESYLNLEAIIRCARETGASAIHPGYGFLSENPAFVRECQKAGITFIGPSPEAMERMGDKVQARIIAAQAGLPVIPGTDVEVGDQEALAHALEIGFPVMVKAAQGGGGIGIRLVLTPEELPEALARSRSLAQSAFGSSQVYLEKYLQSPSHVEVQVIADHHGNALHLFERDCSVQRRNQKIVEESPCVKVNEDQTRAMYEAALALVSYIGYTNAGTVEFLLDQEGHFYFLEMNTRLQVEHPVTEMITGLDLVELQIRVAAMQPLGMSQKDIKKRGHAIEARLYSEDPETFMPVSGLVETVDLPKMPNLRIDGALFPGYEVTPYYDSLMAKVIAWGKSRKQAIATLSKGLDKFRILGTTHNIPLIKQVLEDDVFIDGSYSTQLLSQMTESRLNEVSQTDQRETVAAVAMALASILGPDREQPNSQWKAYSRAAQVMGWPGRGGRW